MRIDCHAHLDERRLPLGDLLASMDAGSIGRTVLIARVTEDLEPAKSRAMLALQRTLLSSPPLRPAARLAARTFYDAGGAVRAAWRPFTRGGKGYRKVVVPDNASVARAVALHPDRLWGWAFVNPCVHDPVEEAERWLAVPGMVGVKAHPYWHGYALRRLEPLLSRLEERRVPVLLHLGFGEQGDLGWLAARFPRLRAVLAHAAFPFFGSAWRVVRDHPFFSVDLSSCHLSAGLVARAVAALGPGKCLYGTDAPYGFLTAEGRYDDRVVRGWIERLPHSSADLEQIWGRNFLALVGARRRGVSLP